MHAPFPRRARLRSLLTGFLLGFAAAAGSAQVPASHQIIGYVFPDGAVVQPNTVSAAKLTRINYAFAAIRDGKLVEGSPVDAQNLALLTGLRKQNPALKILVSVGGWGGSGHFSDMAMSKATRSLFIESAVGFLQRYGLDGLDIDWEYPGLPGAGNRFRPEDKQNYTLLVQELRERFDREQTLLHRRLLLSVAVGAESDFIAHTEMSRVQQFVDTVNLMAYDYYEPTDDKLTGNHAPLHANPRDPKHIAAERSVRAYEQAGVPPGKIILGVPFYGHAWSDVPAENHGLFQPGKRSPRGYVDYSYIVANMLGHGFVRTWDPVADAPTLYNPRSRVFVSYDDPQSLALKGAYVLQHGLGGVMYWDSEADPSGTLVDALHRALHAH